MGKTRMNILFIMFGLAVGVFISETALHSVKIANDEMTYKDSFSYAFVKPYGPYFKENKSTGYYEPLEYISGANRLKIEKGKNEKRIFIVGESVASLYPAESLKSECDKHMTSYEWNVINIGMAGYDSDRIRIAVQEIVKYEPDYIVLIMGNNENHFYKLFSSPVAEMLKVFKYSATVRVLVCGLGRWAKTIRNSNKTFSGNLVKIVETVKNSRGTLITVALPHNNHEEYLNIPVEVYRKWWVLWYKPEAIIKNRRLRDDDYILACAYENIGMKKQEKALRVKNEKYDIYKKNKITIDISKSNGIPVIELDGALKEHCDGDMGYKYMVDVCHLWPALYDVFSCMVSAQIKNCEEGKGEINKTDYQMALKDYDKKFAENSVRLLEKSLYSNNRVYFIDNKNEYPRDLLRYCIKSNPKGCIELFENWRRSIVAQDSASAGNEYSSIRLINVGEALRCLGYTDLALECFNAAENIDKKNAVQNDLLFLYRAFCYYGLDKREMAKADFGALERMQSEYKWISVDKLDSWSKEAVIN